MSETRKGRATAPRKTRQSASRKADAQVDRQDLAAVLVLLRQGEGFTRLQLEAETGLGRAAVSERLATLTDLGLVEEGEAGKSSGGRAPRLIHFCRNAGVVLVAVVGQSTLGMGVADLNGTLVFEHHESTAADLAPDVVIARLETLFDWALEQLSFTIDDAWSIALSLPGPMDGSMDAACWQGVPVAMQLMTRYGCSVHLRSRIQMVTLGEMLQSVTDNANLLVIDVGKEINAGVISAGHLHLGAQHSAGLLGHTPVTGAEAHCRCGNIGCLETQVGSAAIAADGTAAALAGRCDPLAAVLESKGVVTAIDVLQCAQGGDSVAAELLARAGRLIGGAAATLVNVLNPSAIVLTGRIAQTGDVLLAAFRETLYRNCHPLVTRDLTITRSVLGSSGSLVGAAIVATDALFEADKLAGWVGTGTPLQHPELLARIDKAKQQHEAPSVQPPSAFATSERES